MFLLHLMRVCDIVGSALTLSLSSLIKSGRSFMSCGSRAVSVCISASDTALGTALSTSCRTVASLYETERLSFGDSGIACLDQ